MMAGNIYFGCLKLICFRIILVVVNLLNDNGVLDVIKSFLLSLCGCYLFDWPTAVGFSHAIDIQTQTDKDKTEDQGKEGRRELVGKHLCVLEWHIQMEFLCELATRAYFTLILLLVLGIILIRHLFPKEKLLPAHSFSSKW